jgi:hypothetical protein
MRQNDAESINNPELTENAGLKTALSRGNNSQFEQLPQPPLWTVGLVVRSVLYIVLTVSLWQLCLAYYPEIQGHRADLAWQLAFITCGSLGLVTLWLSEYGAWRNNYLFYWLIGMLCRFLIPSLMIAIGIRNGVLADTPEIFITFGITYLLTLAEETVLSVYLLRERYPIRISNCHGAS